MPLVKIRQTLLAHETVLWQLVVQDIPINSLGDALIGRGVGTVSFTLNSDVDIVVEFPANWREKWIRVAGSEVKL